MASHRNHRTSVAVVLVTLFAGFMTASAPAQESQPPFKPPPTVVVYTQPDSAVVEASAKESVPGRTPTAVAGRRKCYLEPDTSNIGFSNYHIYAAHPDERSFYLHCDGAYVGLVWRKVLNGSSTSRPVGPSEVAMYLRDEIPMPQTTIRVNPDIGLVGTESWFWIEGYSGQPINDSTDTFGQLVEVQALVESYEWSFGDGQNGNSSSLGRAYPDRSDVRHVYERSSSNSGEGYPVQVRFVFAVRYRVGDGPWIDLPGISRNSSFRYPVSESQAVISR